MPVATGAPLSSLEALPPELLDRIAFYLDPEDVLACRLVCSILTAAANEHYPRDLSVCFKRSHFENLLGLAHHPVLCKRIRSVHYHPRRFESLLSFEQWSRFPSCTRLKNSTRRSHSAVPTSLGLRAAYEQYAGAVRDQQRIVNERYDTHCLAALFKACSNLDTMILDMSMTTTGIGSELPHVAFAETLFCPVCDSQRRMHMYSDRIPLRYGAGQQPLYAVAEALNCAGRSLKHLTLTNVSLVRLGDDSEEVWRPDTRNLMQSLRTLVINYCHPDEPLDCIPQRPQLADDRSLGSKLDNLPQHAPNVEVLQLSDREQQLELESVLGTLMWPKLRVLKMDGLFTLNPPYFSRFLARHAPQLECLSASEHTWLGGATWNEVLHRAMPQMTRLRELNVRDQQP